MWQHRRPVAAATHGEDRYGPAQRAGLRPQDMRIEQVFLLTRVKDQAVLGLHYRRKEQQRTGQLAIF
ncbi:MAG TPA: hypothetical protein VKP69_01620 [Isosphaeraceae bacterium]|nr:hypothetical protein [Isosphaeraceae bacterium]